MHDCWIGNETVHFESPSSQPPVQLEPSSCEKESIFFLNVIRSYLSVFVLWSVQCEEWGMGKCVVVCGIFCFSPFSPAASLSPSGCVWVGVMVGVVSRGGGVLPGRRNRKCRILLCLSKLHWSRLD